MHAQTSAAASAPSPLHCRTSLHTSSGPPTSYLPLLCSCAMSDVPEDVPMNLDESDCDDPEEKTWNCHSWTTKEQWAWLKRTRPAYLAARKAGHRAKYMEEMYKEYFKEWSECALIYGHRFQDRLTPEEKDVLAEAVTKRKLVRYHISPVVPYLTCSLHASNWTCGIKTAIAIVLLAGSFRHCYPKLVLPRRPAACRKLMSSIPRTGTRRTSSRTYVRRRRRWR